MSKLSPQQIERLTACICGGELEGFEYRRQVDIDSFARFSGVLGREGGYVGSRFNSTRAWLDDANRSEAGASGLPVDVERIIVALLDRREFDSDEVHDIAVGFVATILQGTSASIAIETDRAIKIVSATRNRRQDGLEKQIHTSLGEILAGSALHSGRIHYAKARRFLHGAPPDYENACKEAVCCLEAVATALTGERDFPTAMKKARAAGLIPPPLAEIAVKVYAYRGNEPGVGHGQAAAPAVQSAEAELIFNLVGALAMYLTERLVVDE